MALFAFFLLTCPSCPTLFNSIGSATFDQGRNKKCSTAQKATIHQVTTMLATAENFLFPGHNHLANHWYWWPFTCWWSGDKQSVGSSEPVVSKVVNLEIGPFQRWLAWWLPGYFALCSLLMIIRDCNNPSAFCVRLFKSASLASSRLKTPLWASSVTSWRHRKPVRSIVKKHKERQGKMVIEQPGTGRVVSGFNS